MDQPIEEYYKELYLAMEAMMALGKDTPDAIKSVVLANFWQKQSAFNHKVVRQNGIKHGEG